MFSLFEAGIGTSVETGYDWTQTSSETMSEEESFQVVAVAPPGRTLYIDQVIHSMDYKGHFLALHEFKGKFGDSLDIFWDIDTAIGSCRLKMNSAKI